MATKPTFVAYADSGWDEDANNPPPVPVTTSSTVQNRDRLVAFGVMQSNATPADPPTISNSGTAFTWSSPQEISVANQCYMKAWTATATAGQSMTVTLTR